MEGAFTALDWAVLVVYFAATMAIGFLVRTRGSTSNGFVAGSRALPGWACGLSIFATFLSSITFLALPGKAYASNWNVFVFSLSLPAVTWLAVRFFMPYYRNSGEVSAYALLEHRFGPWARMYASACYLLTQLARMGAVTYLMALPLAVLLRIDIRVIILVTGLSVTIYSFVGGLVAVIWADSMQAIVLIAGALACAILMLFSMPQGPGQIFEIARQNDKFSLGSFGPGLAEPTFWVVLAYGVVINLQNFGIDQNFIQRYIASKSDRQARHSVWLGGLLYVPVSAVFVFIGTELFAFYHTHPTHLAEVRRTVAEQRVIQEGVARTDAGFEQEVVRVEAKLTDADVGDKVFPHFIGRILPPGVTGLVIAAIFAAAMSTISTSLNSSATLIVADWYQRHLRPRCGERETMTALYVSTVVWGAAGTAVALLLAGTSKSILDVWWTLAGILSGGMLGLFLLGVLSRTATPRAAAVSVTAGVGVIVLLTSALKARWWPKAMAVPVHEFLIPVFGTLAILLVGLLITALRRRPHAP